METITLYACSLCRHEFQTQEEARTCEAQGTPEAKHKIGDDVNIEIENNLGSRWSYGGESTKIVAHKVVRLNDGSHSIAYGFDGWTRQRFALDLPERGGLFSAYNW